MTPEESDQNFWPSPANSCSLPIGQSLRKNDEQAAFRSMDSSGNLFFPSGNDPILAESRLTKTDTGEALAFAIATNNVAEALRSQHATDIKVKAVGALIRILMIAKGLLPWRIPFVILHTATQPSVESLKPLSPWWNESFCGGNIKVSSPFLINFIIDQKMPEMARSFSSSNSVRKDDEL